MPHDPSRAGSLEAENKQLRDRTAELEGRLERQELRTRLILQSSLEGFHLRHPLK